MNWLKLIFFVCAWSVSVVGQLNENFSDGNFSNMPTWIGEDSVFTISNDNGNFRLQSNKLQTNSSFYLATPSSLSGNCQWEWFTKLAFNTSSANYIDFFLTASDADLLANTTSGYVVRIGGTSDEISLYKKVGPTWTKLVDGVDGTTNSSNHALRLKVICDVAANWQLYVDVGGSGTAYQFWGAVTDASLSGSTYAGWAITQSTASFFQKHFLDDVYIGPIVYDTLAPVLQQITAINTTQIDLIFNEALEQSAAEALSSYACNSGVSILSAARDVNQPNQVHLQTTELVNGATYELSLQDLADTTGNSILPLTIPFTVLLSESAQEGDIVLNELLSDPISDGVDFVECYNRSEKILDLHQWIVAKEEGNTAIDSVVIQDHFFLLPGKYVLLTADTNRVKQDFWNHSDGNYLQVDLPSYANDAGTVTLRSGSEVIDKVTYSSDWHFPLLNETEGVSLERIQPFGPSQEPSNWHSAAQTKGFGSPGLQNTQFQQVSVQGNVSLASEIISPDNDGFEDVLQVAYTLPSEGMLGKATIYSDQGRVIAKLFEQQLMGSTGNFSWDGITDDSTKAPMGIYVLVFEAFSIDGKNMFTKTQAFTVAGKL